MNAFPEKKIQSAHTASIRAVSDVLGDPAKMTETQLTELPGVLACLYAGMLLHVSAQFKPAHIGVLDAAIETLTLMLDANAEAIAEVIGNSDLCDLMTPPDDEAQP